MQEIAKAHGVSLAQVNIAWALSKGEPYCAPIVGTTSVEKLKDLVGRWTCRQCRVFLSHNGLQVPWI